MGLLVFGWAHAFLFLSQILRILKFVSIAENLWKRMKCIRFLMTCSGRDFSTHQVSYWFKNEQQSTYCFFVGDIWKKHRRIIAPTFHASILKHYVEIFDRQSQTLVTRLEKQVGKNFNVFPFVRDCALDFITGMRLPLEKAL